LLQSKLLHPIIARAFKGKSETEYPSRAWPKLKDQARFEPSLEASKLPSNVSVEEIVAQATKGNHGHLFGGYTLLGFGSEARSR
jgi:hypothetical protein